MVNLQLGLRYLLLTVVFYISTSCSSFVDETEIKQQTKPVIINIPDKDTIVLFKEFGLISQKYDTLMPLFDGLIVTHDGGKWGVIDSAGNEVIPFICDGIAPYSKDSTIGIGSVFSMSHSYNTGTPAYSYSGAFFLFNKTGRISEKTHGFSLSIVGFADFHDSIFVIDFGPSYFLPNENGLSFQLK